MNKAFILPRRRKRLRPYLDLTAMIDTVFNLLIFFAVIATFSGSGARHGIAMDLPKASTASPVLDRVVLALLPNRPPQVNGREVKVAEIGPALEEVTRGEHEAQVVVMADKRVLYADLVAALDQARETGFHKLALATAPGEKPTPLPR